MMKVKRLLIKKILEQPFGHAWSLQGFGMLRLYLSDEVRLHIWNSAFMVPNVSLIHAHPWDFESEIVSGEITNYRYKEDQGEAYNYATIICGPGGGMTGGSGRMNLAQMPAEIYGPTDVYNQTANEIHSSHPADGTITIVTRRFTANKDHARVFWPMGTEWVSAEPRKATDYEVLIFTKKALSIL